MNSWSATRTSLAIWRHLSLFVTVCMALASCVAQAPYKPSQASGGAAGSHPGTGGLQLAPSDMAGGAGGEGAAVEPPTALGCRSSEECALPLPYCSVALKRCVECLSQRNCTGTGRAYCDLQTGSCAYCLADAHCPHTAPYCATIPGACVECLTTENCGGGGLACDRNSYHCVPTCANNADCASSPLTPFCDPARNLCVACVADEDCPAGAPRCTTDTET